jgi:hypothetical protein
MTLRHILAAEAGPTVASKTRLPANPRARTRLFDYPGRATLGLGRNRVEVQIHRIAADRTGGLARRGETLGGSDGRDDEG